MQKIKAKALTAMLLMAIVIAVLPLTVNASGGYILINTTAAPSDVGQKVSAGGNVNLYFGGVTWSGGQFYLILSTNGFSDISGDQYSTTINLSNLTDTTISTYTSGSMTWLVGDKWVNGSIPRNIAGGNYFIKAFDGLSTSVAVTDTYITVTASFDVSPISGTAGQALTLSGYAFTANAKVNLTYLNTTGTNWIPIANLVNASSLGQFTYNTAAPDLKQVTTPAGDSTPTQTEITFNAKDVPGDGYNDTYIESSRGLKSIRRGTGSTAVTRTATNLFGNATDFAVESAVGEISAQVNDTIRLTGWYFYPGSVNILWDGVTNIGTATANGTGYFQVDVTVPMTGVGGHWIVMQDAGVSFFVRVYVTPTMILDPIKGPIGTTVAVSAVGFPASVGTTVYNATITWYGNTNKAVAWALTSSTGAFTTSFVVPNDFGGAHNVVATINGSTTSATKVFTITPQLVVSPSSFANNCTFLVTVTGTGFDPLATWLFYVDNSFYSNWFKPAADGTVVFHLTSGGYRPGMHKVSTILADNESPYAIEAYATFTVTEGNDIETLYLKQINATVTGLSGLSGVNGSMITDIYANTVTIKSDTGIIKANLTQILAWQPIIIGISNGVAQIQTTLGTMTATLSSIQSSISSVSSGVASIQTTLGTVTADLDTINAVVVAIADTTATIQTDVGTIKGIVTATDGKVATIQTDVGTLTMDVADLQTSVDEVPGQVNMYIYIAIALAAVAAIASILCLIMMRRKIAG